MSYNNYVKRVLHCVQARYAVLCVCQSLVSSVKITERIKYVLLLSGVARVQRLGGKADQ